MNIARELIVLADLTDEEIARTWQFMLDRIAWLEYERRRRQGDLGWTRAIINIDNPLGAMIQRPTKQSKGE